MSKTRKKKSKIYFGAAAQQGVEDFLNADTLTKKHKIFILGQITILFSLISKKTKQNTKNGYSKIKRENFQLDIF